VNYFIGTTDNSTQNTLKTKKVNKTNKLTDDRNNRQNTENNLNQMFVNVHMQELLIYTCLLLYTTVVHSTALHSSDNNKQ